MSDFKLTFILKQHTPIIHFQHDQHGATLRATEVKPKLDRFLIEHAFGGILNFDAYKDFLIGDINVIEKKLKEIDSDKEKEKFLKKQKLAFDYKLKIKKIFKNEKSGDTILIPPVKDKWLISEGVQITITSFNKELLLKIKNQQNKPSQLLIDFFNINNFGKRASKGFGAFYYEEVNEKKFKNSISRYYNTRVFVNNNMLSREPFDDRNPVFFYKKLFSEWSRLKSGKNFNENYEKSRIFKYLKEKKLRWEKRWIKKKLKKLINEGTLPHDLRYDHDPIDINDNNTWEDIGNEEYRYGRAILGLAELYEYQTVARNYKYQVIVNGGDVERFKSPITFKIFNKTVYALIENLTEKEKNKFLSSSFRFSVQKKRKNGRDWVKEGRPIPIEGTIITPNENEFNILEFSKNYLQDISFHLF